MRKWVLITALAVAQAALLLLALFGMESLGIGPLAKFEELLPQIDAGNFEQVIQSVGTELLILEAWILAPLLTLLSAVVVQRVGLRPAWLVSAVLVAPTAAVASFTWLGSIGLWAVYCGLHYLAHTLLDRGGGRRISKQQESLAR